LGHYQATRSTPTTRSIRCPRSPRSTRRLCALIRRARDLRWVRGLCLPGTPGSRGEVRLGPGREELFWRYAGAAIMWAGAGVVGRRSGGSAVLVGMRWPRPEVVAPAGGHRLRREGELEGWGQVGPGVGHRAAL